MNVMEISKTVDKKIETSPGGAQCSFITLCDKWAVKVYRNEYERDDCYDLQTKCFDIGLAPEVGEKFSLPNDKFAYITEIVEAVADEREHDNCCAWGWADNNEEKIQPIIEKIRNLTGWNFADHHMYNWGYHPITNELIPIDFG